jgi:hypothetical protein
MEEMKERDNTKFSLGNKVPNSFDELNSMTNNRYTNLDYEALIRNSTQKFSHSMNLPRFTATVNFPKSETEKKTYDIPESEYIWNPPYLKKTQIFPSHVSKIQN